MEIPSQGEASFMDAMYALFNSFDTDGSGDIDAKELKKVLEQAGEEVNDDIISELMVEADTDGSGDLDFEEFCDMLVKLRSGQLKSLQRQARQLPLPEHEESHMDRMYALFCKYDKDGSGDIDKKELAHVLEEAGEVVNDEALAELMAEADTDGDGTLDFEEFCSMIYRLRSGSLKCIQRKVRETALPPTEESHLDKLFALFKSYDKDGSGDIDQNELGAVLKEAGEKVDDEIVAELMLECDTDGDSLLDFEEFCELIVLLRGGQLKCLQKRARQMALPQKEDSYLDKMFALFKSYDKDDSGDIDQQELGKVLTEAGEKVDDEILAELMLECDTDGDSLLDFEEFCELIVLLRGGQLKCLQRRARQMALPEKEEDSHLDKLFALFKSYDKDDSGDIDQLELGAVLKEAGEPVDDEILAELMLECDTDGDSLLDFEEFCELIVLLRGGQLKCLQRRARQMALTKKEEESHLDKMFALFKSYDKDDSGDIDQKELGAVLKEAGEKVDDDILAELMLEVDTDGDSTLDFEEFCQLIVLLRGGQLKCLQKRVDEPNTKASSAAEKTEPSIAEPISASGKTYSIEYLRSRPKELDLTKLEDYLSEDDFATHFKASRADYDKLPQWKKNDLKKKARLF